MLAVDGQGLEAKNGFDGFAFEEARHSSCEIDVRSVCGWQEECVTIGELGYGNNEIWWLLSEKCCMVKVEGEGGRERVSLVREIEGERVRKI